MDSYVNNQIYDIYVIKSSGIPLFAGCTATQYCRTHMGQHELISGFFSALHAFSTETFQDDELETMIYGDITLNFWYDQKFNLIFVFVHDKDANIEVIREKIKHGRDIFVENFGEKVTQFSVDQSVFEQYRDHLRNEGIIPRNLIDTSKMMKSNEKQKKLKPRIIGWLKRKLRL